MYDKMTILKIIGCIVHKPEILIDDNYQITVDDFTERFHKIVFSAIKNLVFGGAITIDPIDVDAYLAQYDKQYKIFNDNDGFEYINQAIELSDIKNFDYYYKRMKKFTLLRAMQSSGLDVSEFYNDSVIDIGEKEEMIAKFEKLTIDEILSSIEYKIVKLKQEFTQEDIPQVQAGKGIFELVESFKETPEMGAPLQSGIFNTIVRGARKKKFYLRSSITGGGKTRLSVADACGIAVPYIYNLETKRWNKTGFSEPTLFISTEVQIDEIQTQMIAFVSGVEEWKILDGKYDKDEAKRIKVAMEHINSAPLWIVQVPDFNIETIENLVKEYKIRQKVEYVFFDYLHSSIKLLTEVSSKAGVRLREDNILLIFADRMKAICNKLNVFMMSATQLNGEWRDAKEADMNLLRGAKAIADKLDAGVILLPVTKKDLEMLQPITQKGFFKVPNMCYHIYKVRRGKFTRVKLWVYIDLGNIRTYDCFVTDNEFNLIKVESTNIEKILDENQEEFPNEIDEAVGLSLVSSSNTENTDLVW